MDQLQGWAGGPDDGLTVPELSRHQIAAFELLDEPCYVIDLGSAGVIWTNQAARAFWGAHAAAGLTAGAACVDALCGIDAGATDASRNVTLFCDGRLRVMACRARRIAFDGRDAVLLRALPARSSRADTVPLVESEQRFRDFAEAASDWFWETDPGGRFAYVSPSITAATGELPENLIGRTRQEMAKASGRPESMAEIEPILKACARREPFANVALGRPGPGGEPRYVSTSGRPRFDASGNFLGYRGAGRNITAQVEAERRLAASEQRFRDFVDVSADWYWELDGELRFCFVSNSVLERTGRDPNMLIGQRPSRSRTRNVTDEAWAAHEADLAARRPFVDFRFEGQDGQGRKRYFTSSGKPVFDADGRFLGYRGTGRDITDLVEAENALRASEASLREDITALKDLQARLVATQEKLLDSERRFRDFAEVASDWYWEQDENLRFTFLSPGNHRLSGNRAEQHYGRTRREVGLLDVSAEQWAWHDAALAERRPFADFRFSRIDPQGRKRYLTISGRPIFEDGVFKGYRGVGRDMTALMEAQQRLAESERRFRDFAEIGSDVTWEMGPDLRITYVSDGIEAITGLAPSWYAGKRNIDLDPEDPSRIALEGLLEERRAIREFPFPRVLSNGRTVHLVYGAKPVFGEAGRFLGYRGTIRDITAQRDAELETDRLRKVRDLAAAADMAKSRFLANMSHELRTPLNAILGFAQILAGEMFGPLGAPSYLAYARDIESSGQRLLTIISDLLDMSRIELNEFQLAPEPVGLAALVGDCVTTARAGARRQGPPIVVAPIDPDWVLDVDRRALLQVLTRLLSNALKFTPATGRISVEMRADGDAVILSVSDTGSGIAPERMMTLFEPFQRSAGEVSRCGNGAGLGLWVSRALIELHGGSLVLSSTVGRGTVAAVTLPGIRVRQRPQLRIAS